MTLFRRTAWHLAQGLLAVGALLNVAAAPAPVEPPLWLAPLQPTLRSAGTHAGSIDYWQLFQPDAPWTATKEHTGVFKIYPELLRGASDDDIRHLVSALAASKIALALESPVLPDTGWCGPGANHEPWMIGLVARLKSLGGNLQQLAMVGPLVDGHVSARPGACHKSIQDVAADAARTVAAMRRLFPDLIVGEIEPIGYGPGFPTADQVREWIDAFQRASGQKPAFLHADTLWGTPWQENMLAISHAARDAGVPFGVIYKGEPSDLSGAAFSADALLHADEVETLLGGPPGQVIIQSWEDYPRRVLPDTDFSTLTGIARAYLRPHSQIDVSHNTLTLTQQGKGPIGNGTVLIEVHDAGPLPTLQMQSIEGTVPHSARSARFILRIHTECSCVDSVVDIILAHLSFEQAGTTTMRWEPEAWGSPAPFKSDLAAVQISANRHEAILRNATIFAVTPDKPFVAHWVWSVTPAEEGSGYLGVVFNDADEREIRRTWQAIQTSWRTVAVLQTGPDGQLKLPQLPTGTIRIFYPGDTAHRSAELKLTTPMSTDATR